MERSIRGMILALLPFVVSCSGGFSLNQLEENSSSQPGWQVYAPVLTGQPVTIAQVNAQLKSATATLPQVSALPPNEIVPLVEKLFRDRMKQRAQLDNWIASNAFDRSNQIEFHHYFQESRYREEMLLELLNSNGTLGAEPQTFPFTAKSGERVTNSSELDFQSGDIILVRGIRNISATIARVGDSESLFSHLLMVYVDANNKKWTVESLAEEGVHVWPLDESLARPKGRAVHLRAKDSALKQLSAQAAAQMAKAIVEAEVAGRLINYDFEMNLTDHDKMFCSEVVYAAYEIASGGRLKLPLFPTSLNAKSKALTDRFQILASTIFSPADMELDPRFEILQEWREPRLTAKLRMQERILDRLNQEMTYAGMRFVKDSTVISIETLVATDPLLASQIAGVAGVILPPGISPNMAGVIYMLNSTIDTVFTKVFSTVYSQVTANGLPATPEQIDAAIVSVLNLTPGKAGYLSK